MVWIFLYNILWPWLAGAFLLLALVTGRARRLAFELGDGLWRERFGRSGGNPNAVVWIHAASLGEVRQLADFLELWRRQWPRRQIHLSVMTRSGLEYVRKTYLPKALVCSASLAPLDFWPCVTRYWNSLPSVKILLLVETEIWPSLIVESKRRGAFLGLINGRVSEKTLRWTALLPGPARRLLGSFDFLCVSEERYKGLLGPLVREPERIVVTGNLKWDIVLPSPSAGTQRLVPLRERLGMGRENFFLMAASTREGEEEIILRVFKRLAARFENLRLALAPRHVERSLDVLDMAKAHGLRAVLFSRLTQASGGPSTTVVDEFGVLGQFFDAADAVFVGGTLVPKIGGHNFLEPASRGKPVLIGPYFDNFLEIAQEFLAHQALSCVKNEDELAAVLEVWLGNEEARLKVGENARQLFERRRGASRRAFEALKPYFEEVEAVGRS